MGGELLWQQDFLSSGGLNFITTASPDSGGAGQLLQPLRFSLQEISILVPAKTAFDHSIPLPVSVNNLKFNVIALKCFKHINSPPAGQYMCLAPNSRT